MSIEPVKPETVKAIQDDPFARLALEATRDFLYVAHRDFSCLTKDGRMIFEHDEAGIAWAALGELLGTESDHKLPSDTTIQIGGVCMNIDTIHMLEKVLREAHRKDCERKIG